MTETTLSAQEIETLFTRTDGSYAFARWARPIVPVVFGIDDDSLTHLKAAIAQTVAVTGGILQDTDPELGANFMWFFCQNWDEISLIPDLGKLVPDLDETLATLTKTKAAQHRMFIYDSDGAIKMCIVFLRMTGAVADLSIQALGVGETLQSLLLWSDKSFESDSPIATLKDNGICIVKPKYAALVRAAYDSTMPASAGDASHVLRLFPRVAKLFGDMEA